MDTLGLLRRRLRVASALLHISVCSVRVHEREMEEGGREGERDRKTKRKGDRQTDREAERERESETSQQA